MQRTIIRLRILVKLTTGDTVPYCSEITMKREKVSCWSIRSRSSTSHYPPIIHFFLLGVFRFLILHSRPSHLTPRTQPLSFPARLAAGAAGDWLLAQIGPAKYKENKGNDKLAP